MVDEDRFTEDTDAIQNSVDAPGTQEGEPFEPRNAVERFYEKVPLSYRQVDLLVKILLGVLALVLLLGIVTGSRIQH